MPTCILHTADWHWGASSMHPIYSSSLFPKIINAAEENGCKYILNVGDIFDKPEPKQIVKDSFLENLFTVPRNIQLIFVPGNHDYTTKAMEYHSLNYLSYIRKASQYRININLVEPGMYHAFEDFDLFVMPSWGDTELAAKEKNKEKPLLLAWHGVVPGLTFTDPDRVSLGVKNDIKKILRDTGAEYIALGDIHRTFKLHARCYYCGPPIQKTYADKDGLLVLELSTEKFSLNKIRLALPKRKTIWVDFKEGKNSEQDIIDFVKKKVAKKTFLKLKFEIPNRVFSSINKRYIEESLKDHLSEIKLENDPLPEIRKRKNIERMYQAKTMREEVSLVIEMEDTGLRKDKIQKTCERYI